MDIIAAEFSDVQVVYLYNGTSEHDRQYYKKRLHSQHPQIA
jgi:hypothetical protein